MDGNRFPLLIIGLGTGVGYLVCNLPPFFAASAEAQAATAACCVSPESV